MKHLLLSASLLVAIPFRAQVACDILTTGQLQGSYAHTWAEPEPGSWDTPNMIHASNRVIGELVLAITSGSADSLCCAPLANGPAVNGHIAVIYRGTCDYALKARYAQDAGALAVVIINNVPGPPVPMGGGSIGQQVHIPVFMIGMADGEAWRAALDDGASLTVLLGNKDGYFGHDVGLRKSDVLLPTALAFPSWLAAQSGDHVVSLGAMVHNYGSDPNEAVALRAVVLQDGETMYDETTLPFPLEPGDSLMVLLPDWVQSSYAGRYQLTYTVVSGIDQHELDNHFSIPLDFSDRFALVPTDPTGAPVSTIGMKPAQSDGIYESCIHFRDPHASRIAITGIDRQVSVNEPLQLVGDVVFTRVYEWTDPFATMDDAGFGFTQVSLAAEDEHVITAPGNSAMLHMPFTEPLLLQDNMRYLFCTATNNPSVFFGYHEHVSFRMNEALHGQPTSPLRNGTNWFLRFVGGPVASLGLRAVDASSIGIQEEQALGARAFPNPGEGIFHLVLDSPEQAELIVRDVLGREVLRQRTVSGMTTLDLSQESPGAYMATVIGASGSQSLRLVVE